MNTFDPKHLAPTPKPPVAVDDVPALEAILASEEAEPVVVVAEPEAPAAEKAPRGFAAMDPMKVRELARRGARVSHERGTAHKFTPDEAKAAGHKGGSAPHRVRGRGKRTGERPGA